MERKVLFNVKDCEYTMQITEDWTPHLRLEPSEFGTGLGEKEVIELIAVLSNWLNEQRKKKQSK